MFGRSMLMRGLTAKTPAGLLAPVVGAVALAMVLSAGCSSDSVAKPTATPSSLALASPSGNPVEEQAREDILAAYSGFLEAYVKASASADFRTKELAKHAGQPLLGELLHNLQLMSQSGVHSEGSPSWNPTVTELRIKAGKAVIEDCFDSRNWNMVGGKSQAPSQVERYRVIAKAKLVNGKWYVYESEANRDAPC